MCSASPGSNVNDAGDKLLPLSAPIDDNQLEDAKGGFCDVNLSVKVDSISNLSPARIVDSVLSSKVSLSGGNLNIDSKI